MPIPNNPNKMKIFRQDNDVAQVPLEWQSLLPLGMTADQPAAVEEAQTKEDAKELKKDIITTRSLLFQEKPYAAVLHDDFIRDLCSHCFKAEATDPCPHSCGVAVYCDGKCAEADRYLHEFECDGYKALDFASSGYMIRLTGRVATRLKVDGGIADVAVGLPNYVQKRQFSRLITHYRAIKRDPEWLASVDRSIKGFFKFYASTSLSKLDYKEVFNIYTAITMNCFAVYHSASVFKTRTAKKKVGYGLYVNGSRFDHSCRPDLMWRFDGNQILFHWTENADPSKFKSEQEFNHLTIYYSTQLLFSKGCLVRLIQQIKDEQKNGWFFQCTCLECSDRWKLELEENSANLECLECSTPFVWYRGKPKLKRGCQCKEKANKNQFADKKNKEIKADLVDLEKQWTHILAADDSDPKQFLLVYQAVLPLAEQYWHPTRNLRLAQLYDRLFSAYLAKVLETSNVSKIEKANLVAAIKVGEKMMATYKNYNKDQDSARFAIPCLQLASLHAAHGLDGAAFQTWIRRAEKYLEENGDTRNMELVKALLHG